MEENKEGPSLIEKLATVTDAMQMMFPKGKIICVYELNEDEFKSVQKNFRAIDNQHKKFSIDISGLEHVFIIENTNIDENMKKEEPPKKRSIKQKLFSWFKSGGGSIQ